MYVPEHLSLEERNVIEKLRQRTINDLTPKMLEDDSVFYRFSKSRDFNLEAAEAMLRNHIQWRKENGVDNITKEKIPKVFWRYIPVSFVGFAKEGNLVGYWDVGNTDLKGVHKSVTDEETMMFITYYVECDYKLMREHSKKIKKPVTTTIYIYDLAHFSLAKVLDKRNLMLGLMYAKLYQDHCPERTEYLFQINAPKYFSLMFNVLKAVITAGLLKKIKCFGTTGYQEELLKLIDADVLPAFLGGQRRDPDGDPLCKSFIRRGSEVPRKYYLSTVERKMSDSMDMLPMSIKRSSKERISLEVDKAGSKLEWKIITKGSDIDFAVLFRESSEDYIEVVPLHKIVSHRDPHIGEYECKNLGTYIFVFDNSHSWIYSKEVYYKFNIREPAI